jgi:hypothetical protein
MRIASTVIPISTTVQRLNTVANNIIYTEPQSNGCTSRVCPSCQIGSWISADHEVYLAFVQLAVVIDAGSKRIEGGIGVQVGYGSGLGSSVAVGVDVGGNGVAVFVLVAEGVGGGAVGVLVAGLTVGTRVLEGG